MQRVLISATAAAAGAAGGAAPSAALSGLFVSHGALRPPFDPQVFEYDLQLAHAIDSLAIAPELQSPGLVSISWPGASSEPSTVARREVDLPDDGSDLPVVISIEQDSVTTEYKLNVHQSDEPVVLLKGLEVVEDTGAAVPFSPAISGAEAVYNLYCSPDADSVTLRPFCADGNSVLVGGAGYSNKDAITVKREKNHHRQSITLSCRAKGVTRNYVLALMSDWSKEDIQVPRVVVESRGKECELNNGAFICSDPHDEDHRTKLLAFGEPTVRYTVESSDGEVEVRLLDQIPSLPIEYARKTLRIVGRAGTQEMVWPIRFSGSPAPGVLWFLGWMLGLTLLLLLLSLLLVLGLSATCAVGAPIGVTEIASAMTLLLQFFVFASALRGETMLTDLCGSFRWVTLFWPAPFTKQRGVIYGDVNDLRNAQGCLVWSPLLLLTEILLHGIVALRVKVCCNGQATFPHRLSFGNWESRVLHWLTFPTCVAAACVLMQEEAGLPWKALAVVELLGLLAWVLAAFVGVKQAVASGQAIWVWHSSAREDGELANEEAGFWTDSIADQLLTHPVNRSVLRWFLPWRWVTTVADIDPERVASDGNGKVYGPNVFHERPHRDAGYPLAKAPRTVNVVRTAAPSTLCRGRRIIAGLLRTRSLDILFTYDGLTHLRHKTSCVTGPVQLTVKTEQLSGPVTGGRHCFFFDGVRMPFVRLGDCLWRGSIGVCLGLALGSRSLRQDAVTFALLALVSGGMFGYVALGRPLSRHLENGVVLALQTAIFFTATAFFGYAAARNKPSTWADVCLWLTAVTAAVLFAYGCLVLFAVYSAIMCPPLEETRFLEGLANCNVIVADHGHKIRFEMPGYSKRGCRDLRAHCSSSSRGLSVTVYPSGEIGTLEFSPDDMAGAIRTSQLAVPLLALRVPCSKDPLGYRHLNVYNAGEMHADIAGLLAMVKDTRNSADVIARNITQQVTAKNGKIVSLLLVPPSESLAADSGAGGGVRRRRGATEIEMI